MIVGVADTHTIIWYLSQDGRLSATARKFIDTATDNGEQIGIASITLVEIVYLVEKSRLPAIGFTRLAAALETSPSAFIELPLNLQIVRTLTHIDAYNIPDMPDRIIAASALHFSVPVISRDSKIQLSTIQTIW